MPRTFLGKAHLVGSISRSYGKDLVVRTNTAGEHLLVINVALDPGHQMLDVFWGGHLRWPSKVLRVLP